jgi:serine/threonine protein kinase
MIKYNYRYKHIIRLDTDTEKLIMKFPKNRCDIKYILHEYNIYSIITHPSFDSFNKLMESSDIPELKTNKNYESYKILVGNYNPNMITFHEYKIKHINRENTINIYINILNILDECFEKYNFIHGDLKSNNILIDITNPFNNIKLIDFEFSLLFNSEYIYIEDNNYKINNYLDLEMNSVITKEFAKFFDIYALCVELVYYSKINLFKLKIYLDTIIETNNNSSFIDFYIIYLNIYMIPKNNLICDDIKCLNLSFISIINNLKKIDTFGITDILKTRILYINEVLNNMMELNLILD